MALLSPTFNSTYESLADFHDTQSNVTALWTFLISDLLVFSHKYHAPHANALGMRDTRYKTLKIFMIINTSTLTMSTFAKARM